MSIDDNFEKLERLLVQNMKFVSEIMVQKFDAVTGDQKDADKDQIDYLDFLAGTREADREISISIYKVENAPQFETIRIEAKKREGIIKTTKKVQDYIETLGYIEVKKEPEYLIKSEVRLGTRNKFDSLSEISQQMVS